MHHHYMILDYGTFGVWGAVLAGGKTIVSNKTFRCRHHSINQNISRCFQHRLNYPADLVVYEDIPKQDLHLSVF